MTERLGSDEPGGTPPPETPPETVDSDEPRLHLKRGAQAGIRKEELFQQEQLRRLRDLSDEGLIEEMDTEEMKIVAAAASNKLGEGGKPDESLTVEQRTAAERLAEREEREKDDRKRQLVQETMRKFKPSE